MRKTLALVVAAGLMVSLAGCSTALPWQPSCDPVAPGGASALISATGALGTEPTVTFPTPIKTSDTQRSVLIPGEGTPVVEGQMIQMSFTVYNATTGDSIGGGGYTSGDAVQIPVNSTKFGPLLDSVECSTPGSRIALALSAKDSAQAFQGADFATVWVIDVLKAYLPKANGANQPLQGGLPLTALAPSGQPGMQKPNFDAPTALRLTTLKLGNGATVKKGDKVVVNYTGWLWDTGTVFDSSWQKDAPVIVTDSTGTGGVVPGFAKAMEGAKVGSQVIAILPPSEGYGASGNANAGISDKDTLVFVIDILGIAN